MEDIIIIGAGDFAKKVIRLIQKSNLFNIPGYTNPDDKGIIYGVRYLGNDDVLNNLGQNTKLNLAFGFAGNMSIKEHRDSMIEKFSLSNFAFPGIISNVSQIEYDVNLGEGSIVFDGAFIDFNAKIGKFSIINLFATVCHDVVIGNNTVLSPKCLFGGGSKVGNNCFIGMHATINPYVKITDNVIIGSGCIVTKDINESGTYVGNPAKKIK